MRVMKTWLRLQKLKRELRKIEMAHKKFQSTEEYKKLNREGREQEDSAFYDVDYLPIFEEIEEIRMGRFLSKVRRYGIPYITWWDDKKEEYWKEGRCSGTHYLTVNGYHKLRHAIREEQTARREAIMGWIPLVTALVGLLGIVTGLLSIIRYWHK